MKNNMTIDVGLRFDRQWGMALPSTTLASPAFPAVVPGIVFAGYASPFTWNNFSPRVGLTYALDASRKTIARASYFRYAGQLDTTTIGNTNPSSTAGSATYRWVDSNGDHFTNRARCSSISSSLLAAGSTLPTRRRSPRPT
jgi:hypothetical protein